MQSEAEWDTPRCHVCLKRRRPGYTTVGDKHWCVHCLRFTADVDHDSATPDAAAAIEARRANWHPSDDKYEPMRYEL